MSSFTHTQQSHINTALHPSYEFHIPQPNQEINCVEQSSKVSICDTEPCSITKSNHSPQSSMVVDKLENGEHVTQKVSNMEKKRRNRNGSLLSGSTSKDSGEGRRKKQKKSNDEVKEEEKRKEEKKVDKEVPEQPPKGYIHVRARRGQATDSHSLAERVTGKALVLDEIINYVQSLQNQVEFLSLKLASVNPMFFDLAMDLDTPMKLNSIASPSSTPLLPCVPQCSFNNSTVFADTSTMATTNTTGFPAVANDYLLDYAFLQGQRSNFFSEYSGGDQFWDVEDQQQKFLKPYGLTNDSSSFN
ncbi:unnamed protein product [Lupinus luteus]|uniref:Uncharacterized protein n=1 Tax=Lupinus luteus TaxID=3873 RepID=A0AAV1Y7W2_LUPLU